MSEMSCVGLVELLDDETGASTAEYAIVTMAAVAFGRLRYSW